MAHIQKFLASRFEMMGEWANFEVSLQLANLAPTLQPPELSLHQIVHKYRLGSSMLGFVFRYVGAGA